MKKILLIITAFLFITSTVFPQSKININSLKEYGWKAFKGDDDEPYTGMVFDLYENGQKKLNGRYRNGIKNGKWTWWNVFGGIDSTGNFRKELFYGQWKFYHSNGQLKAIGNYRNGDGTNRDEYGLTAHGRHGKWTFWHENGLQASEITYKEGEIVGIWITWNEQGQKIWEGTLDEYQAEQARLAKEARKAETALGKAMVSLSIGDRENGLFQFELLVEEYKNSTAAQIGLFFLGRLFYEQNNYIIAKEYLNDYLDNLTDGFNFDAVVFFILADIERKNNNSQVAINYFNEAIKNAKSVFEQDRYKVALCQYYINISRYQEAYDLIGPISDKYKKRSWMSNKVEEILGSIIALKQNK